MNIIRTTTRALTIALLLTLTPTTNRAIAPLVPVAVVGIPSLWIHLKAFPWEGPSRYDFVVFKQAVKEFASGINTKENLAIIRTQLYYMYIDGVCGHASKVGSPRFNEKTKLHEIPAVESRGVFGFVSDNIDPVVKVSDFVVKTGAIYLVLEKGFEYWSKLVGAQTVEAFKTTLKESAAKPKNDVSKAQPAQSTQVTIVA